MLGLCALRISCNYTVLEIKLCSKDIHEQYIVSTPPSGTAALLHFSPNELWIPSYFPVYHKLSDKSYNTHSLCPSFWV